MVVEEADWCSRVGASLFNLVCVDGSPSVVSVRRFSRGSILKPMILDNESTLLLLLMLMMLIKFDFSMYGGRGIVVVISDNLQSSVATGPGLCVHYYHILFMKIQSLCF